MEEPRLAAMDTAIRNLEARTEANHQTIGELRAASARHDTKIEVFASQLEETREDLSEIKEMISDTRRALYITASTMATLTVAVLGVLANLLA